MTDAPRCPTCGAPLGAADLNKPACPYCGTVHPHVARAAQKVEEVRQAMALGPGGVPVVLQGMLGPIGPAPPPGSPVAGPGGPPIAGGPMGSPYFGYTAPVVHEVRRTLRAVIWIIVIVTLLTIVGVGVAMVFAFTRF